MKTREKLVWTEEFSVRNEKIDQQHQFLFGLANQMQELQDEGEELDKIKESIVALYDYVKTHFAYEEGYMATIGYPVLAQHQALHQEIIHKMNEYMTHSSNIEALVYKFKALVYQWAVGHIPEEDKKIARFARRAEKEKAAAPAGEGETGDKGPEQ